jgi:hypothetical protein
MGSFVRRVRATWGISVLAMGLCIGSSALAEPTTQDQALARSLFDQGRALMNQGNWSDACPKLEESQRLDPGVGTQFNLAACYEHVGRLASAWSLYLQVAGAMRASGQSEREKAARDGAALLEPRLSKILIVVPAERRIPGMSVKLDGTTVGPAGWGTPMPADAGDHRVDVTAPGRTPWSGTITVKGEASVANIEVPTLETASAQAPTAAVTASAVAPVSEAEPPKSSSQRTVGLAVGGAGILVFGIGSAVALAAKSHYNDSSSHCNGNKCDQEGLDIRAEARSQGTVASVVCGVGLVALATGAVVLFTAPRSQSGPN